MSVVEHHSHMLLAQVRAYGTCAVAFSAGVDSTVVAKAAQLALGTRAVAVTGVSASLAAGELEEACRLAALIGIRHEVLHTDEFANPAYVRNGADRCYHCKTELYTRMEQAIDRFGVSVILNGANLDDAGDYRPGMTAASEHRVRSPLAECRLGKADVRALAEYWELPVWDKPATPCLSSRVAYGEAVSPERLAMIDAAESFLKQRGLRLVRVRYHAGDVARLEIPVAELSQLCQDDVRSAITARLKQIGFKYVTLDLEGFRSGSLNALVSRESLTPRSTS